jgi:hypothetical protein
MAAYTNATLVGTVIDVDPDDTVTAFIDTAHILVTRCCETAHYTTDEKEMIERWLAAHFYDINRPRNIQEGASGVYERAENTLPGRGLWATKYGQQALMLDTAGGLALMNNALLTSKGALPGGPPRASTAWLGENIFERLPCSGF